MSRSNKERMAELRHRYETLCGFDCGEDVRCLNVPGEPVGVIDVVFADYQSAVDGFAVPEKWYEELEVRPKTPKDAFWYSVVLEDGAILAGELDLAAPIVAVPRGGAIGSEGKT